MPVNKQKRREKIRYKIRKKIVGTTEKPRLTVYRSNKAIYAQLIDDSVGHTLIATDSRKIDSGVPNIEASKQVGKQVAELAIAAGINAVTFDRSGYLYHGRIKAFADGAREAGLIF